VDCHRGHYRRRARAGEAGRRRLYCSEAAITSGRVTRAWAALTVPAPATREFAARRTARVRIGAGRGRDGDRRRDAAISRAWRDLSSRARSARDRGRLRPRTLAVAIACACCQARRPPRRTRRDGGFERDAVIVRERNIDNMSCEAWLDDVARLIAARAEGCRLRAATDEIEEDRPGRAA